MSNKHPTGNWWLVASPRDLCWDKPCLMSWLRNGGIECTLSRFAEGTSRGGQDSSLEGCKNGLTGASGSAANANFSLNFGYPTKRKRLAYQNEPRSTLPRHLRELEHIQERRTGFLQPSEGKTMERTYCCLHQPNEQGKGRQSLTLLRRTKWEGKKQQTQVATWEAGS